MRYIGETCRRREAHQRFLNHKSAAGASVQKLERGFRMFRNGEIFPTSSREPKNPLPRETTEILVWSSATDRITARDSFVEAVDKLGGITIASSHDINVRRQEQVARYKRLAREGKLTEEWRQWAKRHREDLERSKHPRKSRVFKPKQRTVSLIGSRYYRVLQHGR